MSQDPDNKVRVDKWLWAARFFKTRGLATDAINGGKVHVNGDRVKPAKTLKIGDVLTVRRGEERLEVVVQELSDRRGPASVAQALYQETPESLKKREEDALAKKAVRDAGAVHAPRPSKKGRRQIVQFKRSNEF